GGDLNWDYRYCWLRDASFTIQSLLTLNLKNEAKAFVNWLLHATSLTRPELKVLYDVYGRHPPRERVLKDIQGYGGSRPVRLGNAAFDQKQLDLYGEVIYAAKMVLSEESRVDRETQKMLRGLGRFICDHWHEEDAGMWEIRGQKEHFTHSLLLCWVGLKALRELNADHLLSLSVKEFNKIITTQAEISKMIRKLSWNENLNSDAATLRGRDVDANLLLLSLYDFYSSMDFDMKSTYQRVREHLSANEYLFYRNQNQKEGAFILCSFWAIEYLAKGGGTLAEAKNMFERVMNCANDLGLLSEEIDPTTKDLLGNFPLAFSHLGVMSAAIAINKREKCFSEDSK
ncbi:MAG: glycoside hydrolase family 15 protein, partial [Candidatus Omnitrophica bacterium]|nr:glycoside hydrolase family 15 protein [Candidatus Omnitrophota bacterium]